jgi:hypothetical protein
VIRPVPDRTSRPTVAIGEDVGMTGPFGVVARGRDLLASLDAG